MRVDFSAVAAVFLVSFLECMCYQTLSMIPYLRWFENVFISRNTDIFLVKDIIFISTKGNKTDFVTAWHTYVREIHVLVFKLPVLGTYYTNTAYLGFTRYASLIK